MITQDIEKKYLTWYAKYQNAKKIRKRGRSKLER